MERNKNTQNYNHKVHKTDLFIVKIRIDKSNLGAKNRRKWTNKWEA